MYAYVLNRHAVRNRTGSDYVEFQERGDARLGLGDTLAADQAFDDVILDALRKDSEVVVRLPQLLDYLWLRGVLHVPHDEIPIVGFDADELAEVTNRPLALVARLVSSCETIFTRAGTSRSRMVKRTSISDLFTVVCERNAIPRSDAMTPTMDCIRPSTFRLPRNPPDFIVAGSIWNQSGLFILNKLKGHLGG